jgi:hypothetical protein
MRTIAMTGSHKRIGGTLVALVATTAALVAAGPAQAAGNPAPGTYKGGVKGGSVVLKVKPGKHARLTYALKSKCGKAHGRVSLKLKHGRFYSTDRSRTADAASGRFVHKGAKAKGVIARPATARRVGPDACKLDPRHFTAKLANGAGSSLLPSDFGHYSGANATGRPISFDVVNGPDGPAIANFAVDVDTECWGDYNGDGLDDNLLVHVTGFSGKIDEDGDYDIYYAPDDDTEFEFDGTIANGQTAVDVVAGGHFNPDGTPNLVGTYECDSWGDTYSASVQD